MESQHKQYLFIMLRVSTTAESLRIDIYPSPNEEDELQQERLSQAIASPPDSPVTPLFIRQEGSNHNTYKSTKMPVILMPEAITRYRTLEEIHICANMTELPNAITELPHLRLLDLTQCYNLQALPREIQNLPLLNSLVLGKGFKTIPSKVWSMESMDQAGFDRNSWQRSDVVYPVVKVTVSDQEDAKAIVE